MRLIDADKVKELIRGSLSVDTDEDKEYVCGLIDEIDNGWIDVKNELPEKTGDYLIFNTDGTVLLYWYDKEYKEWYDKEWYDGSGYQTESVTHWMPLPESPKE